MFRGQSLRQIKTRIIPRLREAGKLTQEQVAEDAGVSWRYLQELEAGKGTNPSLNVLRGLMTALDCSWNELADRDAVTEKCSVNAPSHAVAVRTAPCLVRLPRVWQSLDSVNSLQ